MSSASNDADLERCQRRVGSVLRGKWRLDSLIGVGGMAAVYAATHERERAAIKILHAHVAVSKDMRARFEQEALAVARLGHPATVQVHAVDMTDDGAPFMVMELLEGESLGQRAYRLGAIPEADLLQYVDALLDVLAVAHDRGVIHRDIKPDNLFVTSDGRLKVLDFGIARMREGGGGVHTRTGAMLGTTAYMAPEQIHARPLDGRADIFGVGATMFRVLAKQKIHEAESDAELLIKMGSTQARPLTSVAPNASVRLGKIVDRALAFDRDHRYPDARAMQSDVQAVLRGQEPLFASLASEVSAAGRAGSAAAAGKTQVDHAPAHALDQGRDTDFTGLPAAPPAGAGKTQALAEPKPPKKKGPAGTEKMTIPVEPTHPGEPLAPSTSHSGPISVANVPPAPASIRHGPASGPTSLPIDLRSNSLPHSVAHRPPHPSNAGSYPLPPISHHATSAAWGTAARADRDKRTPIGLVVALGLVMVGIGSAIGLWVMLGGENEPRAATGSNSGSATAEQTTSPTATSPQPVTATPTSTIRKPTTRPTETATATTTTTTTTTTTATGTGTGTSTATERPTATGTIRIPGHLTQKEIEQIRKEQEKKEREKKKND